MNRLRGSRPARPDGPSIADTLRSLLLTSTIDPEFFHRAAAREPRLASVRIGSQSIYLLNHPDLVGEVLTAPATTKSAGLRGARRILGAGLLTSEGERHRADRRLIQPSLAAGAIPAYTTTMLRSARSAGSRWEEGSTISLAAVGPTVDMAAVGPTVDMAAEMSTVTADIVGRALFGTELGADIPVIRSTLEELLAAYNRVFLPGLDLAITVGTPLGRRISDGRARLDRIADRLVGTSAPRGSGVLAALRSAGADAGLLRDHALTLVLAGYETTAAALTFAWILLAANPPARSWLEAELDREAADLDALEASEDAPRDGSTYESAGGGPEVGALLRRLPRTRAVVAEAMRLYPPAWVLGRQLTRPLWLDGWTCPPGALCLASQWVTHRDERWWLAAAEFRPNRWIGGDGGFDPAAPGAPRAAYFPFGLGVRRCVGEQFAWTEAILVLATLARRWQAIRADEPVRLRAAITLRPAGAVPMRLIRRHVSR